MNIKWKPLIISVAIPLLTGALSALLSGGGMADFQMLEKPPLSPPGWLFPVVWTILYTLMGIASYLVYTSNSPANIKKAGLTVYAVQLFFNFLWSILFFGFDLFYFSFAWLLVLWVLIIVTIVLFSKSSMAAAYLMIPYLLWVTFAAYLNLAIAALN